MQVTTDLFEQKTPLSKKDLKPAKNIKLLFEDIRNFLAGNAVGMTRDNALIPEVVNLLFCKIHDELNSETKHLIFQKLKNESENNVKNKITNLFEKKVKKEYGAVLHNSTITLDPKSLSFVVQKLQNCSITSAERDALGDAFEVFIGPALRGSKGQFFTPRNVVKMAIEILDPEIGEAIIDPACGSGGFLIVALDYIWKKINGKYKKEAKNYITSLKEKRRLASNCICGMDKDSFLAEMTKVYMAIIGDGKSNIFCENSLDLPGNWKDDTKRKIFLNKFDVLLTNPPFGSKIPICEKAILEQYELGHNWRLKRINKSWATSRTINRSGVPPQILFIERCLQFLKENGRMAIVLPDGILGNISDGYVRNTILKNAEILAVVDAPPETFQPSTSTKTSILFLKKKTKISKSYSIFMAIADKCGHDRRGRSISEDDFPQISENYKKRGTTHFNKRGFWINSSELSKSDNILTPRYYNPEIEYELRQLSKTGKYDLVKLGDLVKSKILEIKRGNEIGSKNYGTGDIPFVRTSDISNWEIRFNNENSTDGDIYFLYAKAQDLKIDDILFVNDGGRMVGETAIITKYDPKMLMQSHVRRIRIIKKDVLHPFLLLYLLKMPIVLNQIKSKVFIQATIPTLSNRLLEVSLPIPKNRIDKKRIIEAVKDVIEKRAEAKKRISNLIKGNF